LLISSEETDSYFIGIPDLRPTPKDPSSETESLNGLSEKFVAVESTIFVVEQFRQIKSIISQLTNDEDGQIENYFSQVCFLSTFFGLNLL
jgi:hypothetical protein